MLAGLGLYRMESTRSTAHEANCFDTNVHGGTRLLNAACSTDASAQLNAVRSQIFQERVRLMSHQAQRTFRARLSHLIREQGRSFKVAHLL